MRRPRGLFRRRDVSARGERAETPKKYTTARRPKEISTSPKFYGQLAPEDEKVELILKPSKDSKNARISGHAIQIATRNSKTIRPPRPQNSMNENQMSGPSNAKVGIKDDSYRTIQISNTLPSNAKACMMEGSFRTNRASNSSLRAPSTRALQESAAPKSEQRTVLSFDEEDRDSESDQCRDDDIRASYSRLGNDDDDDDGTYNSEGESDSSSYLREIYEEEKKRERYFREMVKEERLKTEQSTNNIFALDAFSSINSLESLILLSFIHTSIKTSL